MGNFSVRNSKEKSKGVVVGAELLSIKPFLVPLPYGFNQVANYIRYQKHITPREGYMLLPVHYHSLGLVKMLLFYMPSLIDTGVNVATLKMS